MAPRVAFRKTSLIDYPGKLAAVIFFPGCNLRCPWCHNRGLVVPDEADTGGMTGLDTVLEHIEKRSSVLGGVVLSGGEPTLCASLPALIERIKKMNLLVKLDTNGLCPNVLEKLLSRRETRPDFIALDLKLSPGRYGQLLPPGAAFPEPGPGEMLKKTAALLRDSGIDHEFRSLALPAGFFQEDDIAGLAPLTDESPWYLRKFIPGNCIDPLWNQHPPPSEEALRDLAEKALSHGKKLILS
ncbi:anaerobic ribonucleoside-triphosphate reductase activating protein [Breznakiella homolactica]|uniref:Anaerobic ribonucleoside-triphosphate reductase activating protein n=1 Tax=Breznakiella homolactica TaxID=2798577 RepID=A0A7T8B7G9_9SPIR|nr:anaerobic ribonucleoside-triphosphate reductase activating protein [Breznakiella homolactica]QQO07504.1 anaerobic ribonucleoside-triphosphate reductase activating protein [Breznakiella homolactica]